MCYVTFYLFSFIHMMLRCLGIFFFCFFFFKQKTAYEMRISDWSSDVCSSDLHLHLPSHSLAAGAGKHTRGTTKAHAVRAVLLAIATVTIRAGVHSSSARTQGIGAFTSHFGISPKQPVTVSRSPRYGPMASREDREEIGRASSRERGGQ